MRNLTAFQLAAGLFLFSCGIGLFLARHHDLENDEFYSQTSSIHGKTYSEIWRGKIGEGNNSPLFYSMQKFLETAGVYRTPEAWVKGRWEVPDLPSRIILRLNPIIFMSLAVAIIFYYFLRFYGELWGLYAAFLSLSSYMVWAYWVQARPYALWTFLSTAQSLLFLRWMEEPSDGRRIFKWLCVVHLLLALTVVFGVAQVVIVTGFLMVLREKDWRRLALLAVPPVLIGGFYYVTAPKYHFYFDREMEQLIRASFSRDKFYILFAYTLSVGLFALQRKNKVPKIFTNDALLKGLPYLGITVAMLAAAGAVLFMFKLGDHQTGFMISNRYFIFLAPVAIISTMVFTVSVVKALEGRTRAQLAVLLVVLCLTVLRAYKTFLLIKGYYKL